MNNELFFKHELVGRLVVAFSQRKGFDPDDIVDMAFHTAELTLERIQEELERNKAEQHELNSVEVEKLGEIIRRFIDKGYL